MNGESERLAGMYAGLGDGALLRLAEDREGLTDEAWVALEGELQRRRLWAEPADSQVEERAFAFGAGIPGVVPAGGAAVEQALEPGGEERLGMIALASFYDGHELTRACEALEAAAVVPAIQEVAGDAAVGSPSRFEVWVEEADVTRGRQVLRERLGLFPEAEVEGEAVSGEAALVVVGQFESAAEAERVRALLAWDEFHASVEAATGEDGGCSVMVEDGEQERALEVLAARLGVE